MRGAFTIETVSAGLLAAFVGFAGSFPIVVRGLQGVGASAAQSASGLAALSIAMGLCAILLSLKTRMPISVAWSTPGAALLATSGAAAGGDFGVAVGAFLVTGALIVLCGLWKPLGLMVRRIPVPLASAMLAGVLLGLCIAPVRAVAQAPGMAIPVILVWAVMAKVKRLYAVPAAVLLAAILIAFVTPPVGLAGSLSPHFEFVPPRFTLAALAGVALPLFIVTMASQNLPGLAVLKVNKYDPDPSPLLRWTGFFSLASTPFGGHGVNLAAITAAICAGPDAHPDPSKRYGAAIVSGVAYVVMGFGASAATAFMSASPPILIEAVAGLALIPAFAASMMAALQTAEDREAAAITFLVAASGVSFLGIGGAFWGLLAGGAMMALMRARQA